MKTLIATVLVALMLCNTAFAIDKPTSAEAPEAPVRTYSTAEAPDAPRTMGLDLSNVPAHLRWLVILSRMLTFKSVVAPDGA